MRRGPYFVYILMNKTGTVLYIGVSGNLLHRLEQHRSGHGSEFVSKYNVTRLVHYEVFKEITDAIAREKQLKRWNRSKKEALIRSANPRLRDLADEVLDQVRPGAIPLQESMCRPDRPRASARGSGGTSQDCLTVPVRCSLSGTR